MDGDLLIGVRITDEEIDTLGSHVNDRDVIFSDFGRRVSRIIILESRVDDGFEDEIIHGNRVFSS